MNNPTGLVSRTTEVRRRAMQELAGGKVAAKWKEAGRLMVRQGSAYQLVYFFLFFLITRLFTV